MARVPASDQIAASNWWQDILDRRAAFRTGNASNETLQECRNVVSAIETIPPHERVECAPFQ